MASIIVKQASNMSLTGPEYMWIMSSIVLCNLQKIFFIKILIWFFLATYSSGNEPKMSPYDNPNRRKMDFFVGTLGLSFFFLLITFY
jgi:hypothetical protein